MVRHRKSAFLDFKLLFLALLMLGVLAAMSIRLWFIQIRMNVYYCSRIQAVLRLPCRILFAGVGERIHEETWSATDDRISNKGFQ